MIDNDPEPPRMTVNWVATIVALLLGIAGLAVSISIDDSPTPTGGHKKTVSFKIDKSGATGVQTQTVSAPESVVNAIEPVIEDGLRDETPAGAPPEQIQSVQKTTEKVKEALPPLPTAGATAGVSGCRTRFVNNQSSRNGARPIWFPLHYTVSPNVPGWGDVYSIVALFDRLSSQASSSFVLDAEGHCAYIVPIERKPWTQAAGNPLSVSVELIATGKETTLCTGPCLKQLRTIFKTVTARTGSIKSQQGSVYPPIPGCVQHKDGGLAWGGHIDITPFSSRTLCAKLVAGQKPTKKQKWVAHRVAIHNTYQKKCKHKYQRERRPVTCAKLREDARTLDRLIKR